MASINALLKRFESTIAEVNAIEVIINNLIIDSHPLVNIISDSDRFSAIINDVSNACQARNYQEESILIAVKNMLSNKSDYPNLTKEDWDLLTKLRIVK
jgi:hypothetical protein